MEALGKACGIEKSLIDTHRIHIAQPRLWIGRAHGSRMPLAGIELADLIPGHPGSPDRVPRDIRVHSIPEHLAVNFQVRAEFSLLAPQRMFAQGAVFSSAGNSGLNVHLSLGMNPGMPVSTTELSLTRVLIP
jgi:hypothetical protein